MNYTRYHRKCWVELPKAWPIHLRVPLEHAINDNGIYWMAHYYNSLAALRVFRHHYPTSDRRSEYNLRKDKTIAYVRKFDPGSAHNVCKEYHGDVHFAQGYDLERTIVHESLHMAWHIVDYWFGKDSYWEERLAYVSGYCLDALYIDLIRLRKRLREDKD